MHWVTSKSHFRRLNKDSSVVHEKRWSKWKLRLLWGKAWFFIIVRAWRRNAWLTKPQTIFVGFNGSWRKIPTTFLLGKHNLFWSFIPNKKVVHQHYCNVTSFWALLAWFSVVKSGPKIRYFHPIIIHGTLYFLGCRPPQLFKLWKKPFERLIHT